MIFISGAVNASYEYDDGTERIKKTSGGSTTFYVGELYEEKGNDDISYIYMGSQRVASVINGTVMFYLADHLGGSNIRGIHRCFLSAIVLSHLVPYCPLDINYILDYLLINNIDN